MEIIKYSEIKGKIFDFENRIEMIKAIGNMIGLSEEDITILAFLSFGDIKKSPQKAEILKKIKIPAVDRSKYNYERLRKWVEYLRRFLTSVDRDYGVVKMDTKEILRRSRNGEYITVYGLKVPILIYKSVLSSLEKSPDYLINVVLGVYEALGKIIKFLEAVDISGGEDEKEK